MAEFTSRPPGGPLRGGKLGVPANIEDYLRDKADLEDVQKLIEQMMEKADKADVQSLQSIVDSKAAITDVQKKADQTALSSLQTTVNNKADKTTVQSLQTTVNNKADKTDVQKKADQTALSSLQTTVNSKANQSDVQSLQTTVDSKADKSELSNVEKRIGSFYAHKSFTGNTNNNLVYSGSDLGVIRASDFNSRSHIRIMVHYNLTGSGTKRITLSTTDMNGTDLSTLAAVAETAQGAMQMDVLIYPRTTGKVWVVFRSNAHFQVARVYSNERAVDMTKDRLLRLYVQNDNNEAVSEFTSFETYLVGNQ